ncbi:MAG: M20/M25/M40 family metallo-hydrolase [Anaerolineales bacterium]|nr:M20/M25/M40 family metallo-hydrolase [Anaerolineales bacterium]
MHIGGMQGGHSGVDINKGRGSASELMARLLWNAPEEMGLRVANLDGGSVYNAIPSDATALVVVSDAEAPAFEAMVATFGETVQAELAATEPTLFVEVISADMPATVMDRATQQALLGAVYGSPQGVQRMSDSVEDLVETSDSMGILSFAGGAFDAGVYIRSAIDSERDDTANRLTAVFELAGAEVSTHDAYSSWPANPDSPILALMQTVYQDLFGVAPEVTAVHAGLETSVAGTKNPELDMISVGPTIVDVHSPQERLEVASVEKAYDLIVATLEAMTKG